MHMCEFPLVGGEEVQGEAQHCRIPQQFPTSPCLSKKCTAICYVMKSTARYYNYLIALFLCAFTTYHLLPSMHWRMVVQRSKMLHANYQYSLPLNSVAPNAKLYAECSPECHMRLANNDETVQVTPLYLIVWYSQPVGEGGGSSSPRSLTKKSRRTPPSPTFAPLVSRG